MTAVQSPPQRRVASAGRIVLDGISWATYESLLADYPDCQTPRFAYDRGTMEIVVTQSSEQEEDNRTLAMVVEVVAEELGRDIRNLGETTFRREAAGRGFEPDSSFYIQHEPHVRGRRVDPATDPPPDLIIEVDLTSSSLPKQPLYAGLGIPEVWRYDGQRVAVLLLRAGAYEEAAASAALPPLTAGDLTRFLEESRSRGRTAWLRSIRGWARQHGVPTDPTS